MSSEKLIGFFNPYGSFPAPVVPVIHDSKSNKMFAYYPGDGSSTIVDKSKKYFKIKEGLEYDKNLHCIFAYSEDSVVIYRRLKENEFYHAVFESDIIFKNPFIALTIVSKLGDKPLFLKIYNECKEKLSDSPRFCNIWIKQFKERKNIKQYFE